MVEPLRILSYNVRYFGHSLRGLASTRTGKRSIARGIASLAPLPHILCLQEVETSSLRSTLAFRPAKPEETQLESFMAELEHAFEELDRPFPYEAFYFRAHANRIGSRTLAEFVRRQSNGEPLVVCGDFNSPPGSPVYKFLTEEAGLVGVQNALGQIRGHPREFPTAGFLSLRMHLDHLFCNGRVRWLDLAGTLPFGDRRNPFPGKSDHVPLIGRFEMDGE